MPGSFRMTAQSDMAVYRLRLAELTFQLVLGRAQLQRFVGPFLVRNLLPDTCPVVMVGHILRHFDAPVPVQHGLVNRHRSMQYVCHGSIPLMMGTDFKSVPTRLLRLILGPGARDACPEGRALHFLF